MFATAFPSDHIESHMTGLICRVVLFVLSLMNIFQDWYLLTLPSQLIWMLFHCLIYSCAHKTGQYATDTYMSLRSQYVDVEFSYPPVSLVHCFAAFSFFSNRLLTVTNSHTPPPQLFVCDFVSSSTGHISSGTKITN